MSATCDPAAEQVTRNLGFDCHDVSPVVSLHNPFALAHWTMPVLELVIIGGRTAAVAHRAEASSVSGTPAPGVQSVPGGSSCGSKPNGTFRRPRTDFTW